MLFGEVNLRAVRFDTAPISSDPDDPAALVVGDRGMAPIAVPERIVAGLEAVYAGRLVSLVAERVAIQKCRDPCRPPASVRPCASKERRGGFRIGGAEVCGMESGMGAKRIGDAARILEAQNEVLYAEEWKLSEIPVVGTMQAD